MIRFLDYGERIFDMLTGLGDFLFSSVDVPGLGVMSVLELCSGTFLGTLLSYKIIKFFVGLF